MKHINKLKLARRISGIMPKGKGVFESSAWEARKDRIAQKVLKKEVVARERAKQRKLKILDDKGKEHKVGEIFESETLTLEV